MKYAMGFCGIVCWANHVVHRTTGVSRPPVRTHKHPAPQHDGELATASEEEAGSESANHATSSRSTTILHAHAHILPMHLGEISPMNLPSRLLPAHT